MVQRGSRDSVGVKEHRVARPSLEDKACIASERDFATRLDPTLIDRDSYAVVADATAMLCCPAAVPMMNSMTPRLL
jgi:hypothetical protein